jgi:hypothetical protein
VKTALLLVAVSVILLSVSLGTALAKNTTVGIYAIVSQVAFEPNGTSPNRVRISGVFVVPVRMSSGSYQKPQRGYLYFRIAPGAGQATRRDWNELKTIEGSGEVVAFGQYWVPNRDDPQGNPHHSLEVTVHAEGESGATPDVYPIALARGVTRAEAIVRNVDHDPDADNIGEQLQIVSRHPDSSR